MNNKRDVLPIIIASVVALVITGVVRWLIPGGTVIKQHPLKKELSLPDIPLMVKSEQKKIREIQVLVTSTDIKKNEKIAQQKLTWKNWPANAVQPYFIAKDDKGAPMNNRADYGNAIRMWAKNDIPAGIPLTINMLTSDDPVVVAAKLKKEKEEAERKKLEEKKKNESIIQVGYRAVTFPVDQRSGVSVNMLSPGDLVDILINESIGNKTKTHVYRAVKILAIDGITKLDSKKAGEKGLFESAISLGSGMMSPKNVTLEIKVKLVNTMLKQVGSGGIMISLRNQKEKVENAGEEEIVEDNDSVVDQSVIRGMNSINKKTSAEILKDVQRKKQDEERDMAILIHNMNALSKKSPRQSEEEDKKKEEEKKDALSKYEVVSGKITGNKMDKKEEENKELVKIHRNLTTTEVQFSKDGKIMDASSSTRSRSSMSN